MATNEVIITGNAGGDCQLRYGETGKPVAGFSLGHNAAPGEQAPTVWLPVVIFGEMAETLTPRISSGAYCNVHVIRHELEALALLAKVYGSLRARQWTDKETVFPRRDPADVPAGPSGRTPASHGQRYDDRRNRRGAPASAGSREAE